MESNIGSTGVKVQLKFFRISCRYSNVIRQDLYELVEVLGKMGYEFLTKLPMRRFKFGVGGSGPIARKGDVIVDVNTDAHIIGVSSLDVESVVREFASVEDAVRSELMLDLRPLFYEVLVEAEVVSGSNPLEVISKVGDKFGLIGRLTEMSGMRLGLFGVRLCESGRDPDGVEWLDVEVNPFVSRAGKAYYVSIVYRRPAREDVLTFARKVLTFINSLISGIESYSQK